MKNKIVNLALPRCGTTSFSHILNHKGVNTLHFIGDQFQRDFCDVLNDESESFDSSIEKMWRRFEKEYIESYDAFCELMPAVFIKQFFEKYPNFNYIYVYRNKKKLFESSLRSPALDESRDIVHRRAGIGVYKNALIKPYHQHAATFDGIEEKSFIEFVENYEQNLFNEAIKHKINIMYVSLEDPAVEQKIASYVDYCISNETVDYHYFDVCKNNARNKYDTTLINKHNGYLYT